MTRKDGPASCGRTPKRPSLDRRPGVASGGVLGPAVTTAAALSYGWVCVLTLIARQERRHPRVGPWIGWLVAAISLVDAAVLDALGPEGYLVNVARGSVVDEDALVAALEAGRIAGAGLDVFADEPHVPEALLGRDDVVLLPHVGSATVQTREAMGRLVLDNVDAFLARGELVTPVG